MKKISCITVLLIILSLVCLGITSCANKEAEKAAIRANDIADCNNLMGLHVWYHGAFMNDVELEKCWVTTPELTSTAVWAQNANYWIGMDNIKAYYGPTTPREQTKGGFQFHATTTGVVEVAEDGKTAKGVWYTNGAIGQGKNLQGMWERYGIDFVRENGVWKIWHLHVYTDLAFSLSSGSGGTGGMGPGMGAPPSGGQGAPQGMGQGAPQMAEGGAPTGAPSGEAPTGAPTGAPGAAPGEGQAERFGQEAGGGTGRPMVQSQATADPGYKELSSDTYADLIPRPPEPYNTFSETWSYGDPDEVKMFSGAYREWSEIKVEYNK